MTKPMNKGQDDAAQSVKPNDSATTGTATTDSSSAQVVQIAQAPNGITREQASDAMVAIDDLRVRLVKEIKSHRRAQVKAADLTTGIELRRREAQLTHLQVLHQTIGMAFGLGGY